MTSRRSDDSPTTDDWRSQKNGAYFDSIWPVDSQGRRTPASTQITVTPSASILETSRAAQAANRDKLDRRDNESKIQTEATRLIRKDQLGRKQNNNEITRGVPENEIMTVLPKRRFGGEDFAWILQEFKEKLASSGSRLEVVGSEVSGSKNIVTLSSPFEIYRFYDPLAFGQPFQLPSSYTTYDKSNSFPGLGTLIHFPVVEIKKDRLFFEVSGTLQAEADTTPWIEGVQAEPFNSREQHTWKVGLFFDAKKLNKSSYVYFFAKKLAPKDTTLVELRNVDEGFYTLAGLDSEAKYPEPQYISGDASKIYIERIELTAQIKANFMALSTDSFGNPTTKRTFDWSRTGAYTIEGSLRSNLKKLFVIISNSNGSQSVGAQFETESVTFHDQIELIYTDKDYGELIWAE